MNKANQQPLNWANDETLRTVRPEVRRILQASQGFQQLSPDEQRDLARTMVKVSSYMANPDGLAARELSDPRGGVLAREQADATEQVRKRLAQDPGFAGEDFKAGAVEAGVEQFGEMVQKVDFPNFVSGLIQNVFQAIVDSSLQQMRAYGELLANVAKTVDQFARDNITENNARDWLTDQFPDDLGVSASTDEWSMGLAEGDEASANGETTPAPQPKLEVVSDDATASLRKISEQLEMREPVTDLSDEAQERRLVYAARLQIARSRQQLLASMVMLGINRIVVTDGLIHAKVVFSMRASDVAKRQSRASMYDQKRETARISASASYGGWFSPWKGSVRSSYGTDHVATVESSVDDTSESRAEVKAQLTGEVRVNFKSDYMPMDRMASPEMIAAIQGNAQPLEKPTEGT